MKRRGPIADACTSFDPWTAPAIEAHRLRARHVELEGTAADPLKRWYVARAIAQQRHAVEAPDLDLAGRAVMGALAACLSNDLMPPPWLVQAFGGRVQAVLRRDVKTWTEAFGRPWPRYTRVAARRRSQIVAVHAAVQRIRDEHPDTPTTRAGLFARVAEEVPGLSSSLAEKLFYELTDTEVVR